jgi:N-methylhydantoinase B
VTLAVQVRINHDGILFDFTGSDPQRRAPVNATFSQTFSICAYVTKCLIEEDIPANAGFYQFVRILAPEGTVVNCAPPAPVVGGWETAGRLGDVLLLALAGAVPDRVPAGTKGMMCHAGFGGIEPSTGEYICFLEALAGGYGGRSVSDGPDAVQVHGQNTENAPIEEMERNYPVRVLRYELIPDSEGPGTFRGGLGLRRDYQFPYYPVTFTVLADRDRDGPAGIFGGLPGQRAEYLLNPDSEGRRLNSKSSIDLVSGDIVSYRTCGGGGYGPPAERDPALVLADAREGKISVERARTLYGVVIDAKSWQINQFLTAAARGHGSSE